jgi:RNA polymerase sigma factor (sigma-70 family)
MASPDLAGDVVQSVFTDLARKAASLSAKLDENASLLGWLYRSTRFAALTQLRNERRRHVRERQVMEYFNPTPETAPDWERVAPVLDEAMADLSDEDREALLLRFFKNSDFRAIGTALGVSDDTAQKRVSRAVERLRKFFSNRGVTVGASGLAVVISANAVQAAPIGFALTISSAATAIAETTLASATTATAIKTIAMTTLQKGLITTIVVAGLATPLIIHYQGQAGLREENSSLRQKLQQQLDASVQLETDNAQLSKLVGQATNKSLSDEQFRELLRLRGEVGQLRNQKSELEKLRTENSQIRATRDSNPALSDDGQRYFSKESWAFVGYAKPESTFQSVVWAMSKGDLKTMLASVSPEEQVRMEKEFAGKSEEEIVAGNATEMEKIKGFRILKNEPISDDEVILTIFGDGKEETMKVRVKRIGNEWKLAGRVKDVPR